MTGVVIVAARRTPIGRFLGAFAETTAPELGGAVARAVLEDSGIPEGDIDELIFGNARSAGTGPNPARQVARLAGLPDSVPSFTVNKACGSSLKSILLGAQAIRLGEASTILAGGTENMTRVPYLLERARRGYRMGHGHLVDAMYQDGFLDPLSGMIMGETAEKLARRDQITRDEQDAYALRSQQRAGAAWDSGRFLDEVVPVTAKDERGREFDVDRDEHMRPDTSLEKLGKLKAVFDEQGTVTAGNSSGITDGAAAVIVMDEERARAEGRHILARLVAHSVVGVDPTIMGIGPVPAMRNVFEKTGLGPEDIDLFEINEAFAAQVLACLRQIPLPEDRLNVNGGAIALGHPIGASGARIVVTLLHEMIKRDVERGMASLCISGGQGMALLLERTN
jgi:acetyl-CoA C-acetyltransferase